MTAPVLTTTIDEEEEAVTVTALAPAAAETLSAEPVERPAGARLLDEVRAFIGRFWVAPNDAALDAVVAWIVGTHCTDQEQRMVFDTYPHLYFGSKTPASGKSTALKMVSLLVARGELMSNYTTPGLLGLIDAERASLMLDEFDTHIGSGSGGRDLRALLLDSYKQGGCFVHGNRGNSSRVKRTPVYAPVALAGMWQTWISNPQLDAVRTRTVLVPCAARRAGQDVESYRSRVHDSQAKALNAGLAKFGRRHAELLAEAWPQAPEGMEDRDAELVEPLLAVADAAGGDWPQRIRHAVLVLLRNEPTEDEAAEPTTPLEMLLADLGMVFGDVERLASRTIVERLQSLPGSGWRRYPSPQAAGKEVAEILRPVGVAPRPVKLDGVTVRGYDRTDLVAAGMQEPATTSADEWWEVDAEDLPF